MHKKAFTIVELAIVLVVIGIILAMAVKGRALVRAAKVRAEVAKFYRFESAFSIYYSKTGNLPQPKLSSGGAARLNSTLLDNTMMFDSGLLTQKDVNADYLSPNFSWGFSVHTLVPNSRTNTEVYRHYMQGTMVGAQALSDVGELGRDFTTILICYLEVILDDQSGLDGYGRLISDERSGNTPVSDVDPAWDKLTPENYKDCSTVPPQDKMRNYSYRVF